MILIYRQSLWAFFIVYLHEINLGFINSAGRKRRWSTPGTTSKHSGEDRSFNCIINFQDICITFESAEHNLLEEAQLQVLITENTEDLIHQPPLFPLISSFQKAAVSPSCRVAGPPPGGVRVEANREGRGSCFCPVDSVWCLKPGDEDVCVCVLVAQSCLTLCNSMDCTPPGFSVHGILQARILEWIAIPFSRGSSQPRDGTQVSWLAGEFFTTEALMRACASYYSLFLFLAYLKHRDSILFLRKTDLTLQALQSDSVILSYLGLCTLSGSSKNQFTQLNFSPLIKH